MLFVRDLIWLKERQEVGGRRYRKENVRKNCVLYIKEFVLFFLEYLIKQFREGSICVRVEIKILVKGRFKDGFCVRIYLQVYNLICLKVGDDCDLNWGERKNCVIFFYR